MVNFFKGSLTRFARSCVWTTYLYFILVSLCLLLLLLFFFLVIYLYFKGLFGLKKANSGFVQRFGSNVWLFLSPLHVNRKWGMLLNNSIWFHLTAPPVFENNHGNVPIQSPAVMQIRCIRVYNDYFVDKAKFLSDNSLAMAKKAILK